MPETNQASIIIPTYNRAVYLSRCLEALVHLNTDRSYYEIIVIDNNSSDNTKQIALDFIENHAFLNIRYIQETCQGASFARNRGIQEAKNPIICFLDDDSPPTPEWLNNIQKGFFDPTVGCAGGPSELDYQGYERPSWLRGDLQGLISGYSQPFTTPTLLTRWEQFPLSCNLAIRKEIFSELGLFRGNLDRSGVQVLAAGDTEMVDRIFKAGWKVIYIPDAIVHHLVAPERLEKAHIYRIGRGLAASHIILTSDPNLMKILYWFASDSWYAIRLLIRFIIAFCTQKGLWFDDYMRFWMVFLRIPLRIRALLKSSINYYASQTI